MDKPDNALGRYFYYYLSAIIFKVPSVVVIQIIFY